MDQIYKTWVSMKHRCHGKGTKDQIYRYYRDKGISVCDEWRFDFPAFREWCLGHGFQKGLTIDRIDSDGNYCPENCRWVTRSENSMNKNGRYIKRKAQPQSLLPKNEQEILTRIASMFSALPYEKQWFILGYAEGIADAKEAEHGGDPRKQDGTCQGQS